jgi:DNA/RNA endonuclease YhcR with UshA esterase domain
MVTDVWDNVVLAVTAATTVAALKGEALTRALRRPGIALDQYIVKFKGAQVFDESLTVAALGAGPNSPFIVLPLHRQAVR